MADKSHVRAVNSYIPLAKKNAAAMVKELGRETEVRVGVDGKEFVYSFFTEFFHNEMTRTLKAAGLRR